jgi:hypothetical protein
MRLTSFRAAGWMSIRLGQVVDRYGQSRRKIRVLRTGIKTQYGDYRKMARTFLIKQLSK